MITAIMKLRPVLPRLLWAACRSWYWKSYWKREHKCQQLLFGKETLELAGSERALLIESVSDRYPFENLLEIGCAYGQNFHILGPLFPDIELIGVDSDPHCITEGNSLLQDAGIGNAELLEVNARSLEQFQDKSFDIVCSCASLLYIGDEQIDKVFSEMFRLARRAIVLLEQNADTTSIEKGVVGDRGFVRRIRGADDSSYWIRDYHRLLRQYVTEDRLSVTKVPFPIWQSEHWQEFGCLIEIDIV